MTRLRGIAEGALAADDPARMRDALADSIEEADRVVAMLHTLMNISEAETGTMALEREPVSLAEIVAQTVDLYEDAADDRGIRFEVSVDRALVVPADRTRLRQVLANLVDNAVKYSPDDAVVAIAASSSATEAILTVTDHGPGITPDELPRIWERLFRGDRSRSTGGLGLGLSLVKAIVEAHGGSVAVQSAVGTGSRFEVRLPLAPANLSPM